MSERFDVAVVGGGPAGSSLAAHLSRGGREVVLCDAARFPRHKPCGEFVPPVARREFAALGVLAAIDRLGPRPISGMAVVAPDGTRFLGRYGGGEPSGMSLRRYDLDAALIAHARRSGAEVREGWRLVDLTRNGAPGGYFDLVFATAGGPRVVRARALAGADGRNSLVARRLGLRRPEPGHRRFAVLGHFRGVEVPADHGEMIVTAWGYCGINPLPGGLANVCLVVDPRRLHGPLPGRAGLVGFFDRLIAAHPPARRRMAGATLADGLWATGPMACRTASPVADGALLVGDAAGFFDPFTGEGIGMALHGAALAAEALEEGLRRGDLTRRALSPYEARRRAAFAARLRLDRLIQWVLPRPRLASFVARRLGRDQGLADLLARVAGDSADAGLVLRPGALARLLLA